MPLSEREQRILEEIEKSLYQEDPTFARSVHRKSPHVTDRKHLTSGALAFVAGFAILIAFFITSHILIGVLAFGVMVTGIVLIANSFRGALSSRSEDAPGLGSRVAASVRGFEERMKERYRKR